MLGDKILHDPLPLLFLLHPILQLLFTDPARSREAFHCFKGIADSMDPLSWCQVPIPGSPLFYLFSRRWKVWQIERHTRIPWHFHYE